MFVKHVISFLPFGKGQKLREGVKIHVTEESRGELLGRLQEKKCERLVSKYD